MINPGFKLKDLKGQTTFGKLGENIPINIEVARGKIASITQAKEASLLFRLICGRGEITSGEVFIHDLVSSEFLNNSSNSRIWFNNLGLAFRDRGLIANQSIYENVALPWKYYGALIPESISAEQALKEVGIPEKFWNERPHMVTWSMRKWTLLARSCVLSPKILFLDDPTTLLSFDEYQKLKGWIQCQIDKGITVIIGSDNTPFTLAISDYIIDLNQSQIYEVKDAPVKSIVKALGENMSEYLRGIESEI